MDMIESVKTARLRKEQEMRKKERDDEQAKHDIKAEVVIVVIYFDLNAFCDCTCNEKLYN